jgi:hypothetical protein
VVSERTVVVDVETQPASDRSPEAVAWRAAVAEAAGEQVVDDGTRYQVEVYFRLPAPGGSAAARGPGYLNSLIATTLDALGGVIGWCPQRGRPHGDDGRVDRIIAGKRTARNGESVGARIRVTELPRVTGGPA